MQAQVGTFSVWTALHSSACLPSCLHTQLCLGLHWQHKSLWVIPRACRH